MPLATDATPIYNHLTPGEPVLRLGGCPTGHTSAHVTGYVVVATSTAGPRVCLTDLQVLQGCGRYGEALALTEAQRAKVRGTRYDYAVTATLYRCGCRSDGRTVLAGRG